MVDGLAHICSTRVACSATDAMAYLRAPENLAAWAVGMGEVTLHADGAIEGAFPGTNQPIWARIDADDERSIICFHLGGDSNSLVPRIVVRVVPGEDLEESARSCVVSLIAWRLASMDDARWQGLKSGHESEILEIKRLIEARVSTSLNSSQWAGSS